MGQVLHGCATTTHAVRTAIQRSKAPLKELAARHGLNHKTVAKWRKRAFVNDAPMGPKTPHSTVLSSKEEAIIVAFRKQWRRSLAGLCSPMFSPRHRSPSWWTSAGRISVADTKWPLRGRR